MSLPCVLFLFMPLQSCYTRKNHLCVPLMLSLFVPSFFPSFFLSFWLSFFPSFFHCLEFMPADCLGVDLLDLLSIFTLHFWEEFEVPHSRAGSFQDFETWQDSAENLSRCTHLLCQLTICNDSKFEPYILVLVSSFLDIFTPTWGNDP